VGVPSRDESPYLALALAVLPLYGLGVNVPRTLSILERLLAFARRNRLTDAERARLADDRARRKEHAARKAERKGKTKRARNLREAASALRQEAADFRALE